MLLSENDCGTTTGFVVEAIKDGDDVIETLMRTRQIHLELVIHPKPRGYCPG